VTASRVPDDLARLELLTTFDVCRRWRLKDRTVLAWAETGKLPAIRTPGGQWRFQAADVEAVLAAAQARYGP
jgi:excisionase family DNA binding protein